MIVMTRLDHMMIVSRRGGRGRLKPEPNQKGQQYE